MFDESNEMNEDEPKFSNEGSGSATWLIVAFLVVFGMVGEFHH